MGACFATSSVGFGFSGVACLVSSFLDGGVTVGGASALVDFVTEGDGGGGCTESLGFTFCLAVSVETSGLPIFPAVDGCLRSRCGRSVFVPAVAGSSVTITIAVDTDDGFAGGLAVSFGCGAGDRSFA